MDALLQFASVFCTVIAIEKHFDPLMIWRGLGGLKKFSRLAIARHILGLPHCNSTTADCAICMR